MRAQEERLELGGEKQESRRGDTGGCMCVYVCASVNGKGGVYKMEIYDRDTVASFSLSTLEIIRPSFLMPAADEIYHN